MARNRTPAQVLNVKVVVCKIANIFLAAYPWNTFSSVKQEALQLARLRNIAVPREENLVLRLHAPDGAIANGQDLIRDVLDLNHVDQVLYLDKLDRTVSEGIGFDFCVANRL
jgi:hypothetical protein